MSRSNKTGPWRVKLPSGESDTDAAYEVENSAESTITVADHNCNLFNAEEHVLSTDTKNLKLVAGNAAYDGTSGKVTIDLSSDLSSITAIHVGANRMLSPAASAPTSAKNAAPSILEVIVQTGTPNKAAVYGFTEAKAKATADATLPYFAVGPPA